MSVLGVPKNTVEVLQKYQFRFRKKYGQNFLIDPHVLERIVEESNISKEDLVLEIGPGIGTLTQYLCEHAGAVLAVEIDEHLIPILQETLESYDNVRIIHQDILQVDIRKLLEEQAHGRPVKVVANLPYYITTPILFQLFESGAPLESITIMVQREVAQRMQAQPGTKAYGALSLAVQYYADAQVTANVPPNCFMPRPNVGSAVIRLTFHKEPRVQVEDPVKFFQMIRAAFGQRRKTLQNSLQNAASLSYRKEQVSQALEQMGLPGMIRGEALSLEQFAQLYGVLEQEKK